MTYTDSIVDVSRGIQDYLLLNKGDLKDIWYGDQDLIPRLPAACVEPGPKIRTLNGSLQMSENELAVFIMVYHGQVADTQVTKQVCDEQAERIEALLHTDKTLGGLVVFGFCRELEPGYAERGRTLMYSTRITWQGLSKTMI